MQHTSEDLAYNLVYDKAQALTKSALNYRILNAGVNPDEDLRKNACQILRAKQFEHKKGLSNLQAAKNTHSDNSDEPEWMRELYAVLVEYWETGETPDDLDDDWFDEMIERVSPLAFEEKRLQFERNRAVKKGKQAKKTDLL